MVFSLFSLSTLSAKSIETLHLLLQNSFRWFQGWQLSCGAQVLRKRTSGTGNCIRSEIHGQGWGYPSQWNSRYTSEELLRFQQKEQNDRFSWRARVSLNLLYVIVFDIDMYTFISGVLLWTVEHTSWRASVLQPMEQRQLPCWIPCSGFLKVSSDEPIGRLPYSVDNTLSFQVPKFTSSATSISAMVFVRILTIVCAPRIWAPTQSLDER